MKKIVRRYSVLPRNKIRKRVQLLLEHYFKLHSNTVSKILKTYFDPSFLPRWYFYSNSIQDIANHVYITSQLLSAKTSSIKQKSVDGSVFTYFQNVGYNTPDTIIKILKENMSYRISSIDAIRTKSGIYLIMIEKQSSESSSKSVANEEDISVICNRVRARGKNKGYRFVQSFIDSLSETYLYEESHGDMDFATPDYQKVFRIERHLDIYEQVQRKAAPIVYVEEASDTNYRVTDLHELRINIGLLHCDNKLLLDIFALLATHNIQLTRLYFDTFVFLEKNMASTTDAAGASDSE